VNKPPEKVVIDSSVLFAALFRGSDAAVSALCGRQLVTSAVSHAELLYRGMQSGTQLEYVSAGLDRLSICVFAVHTSQAIAAASLRQFGGGISLSPEAWFCFGLAQSLECPVVTSDPAWLELRVGVPVVFVQ
jgi:PIN domain nuclease of toxin-antitoxin system